MCDPDSVTVVHQNWFPEEATLLEEKAQCHCNNPRHCHNDGQPDFGDQHSGFFPQDDPEMRRRHTG